MPTSIDIRTPTLTKAVQEQTVALNQLITLVSRMLRPKRPGPIAVIITGENHVANTMVFDVALPALEAANDVVSRELTVLVAGTQVGQQTVGSAVPSVTGLQAPQGASVELQLIDIDDAGNRSQPSTLTFVANDTIPPAKPGEMAVTVTGEV